MKCHSCGQPFTPRRPHHRYCDACYREMMAARRGGLHPYHPQLRWLESRRFVVWVMAAAVPALVILGVGRLVGWW